MNIRVRKLIKTKAGAILLTLTDMIPNDWDYVQISCRKGRNDDLILHIRKIEVTADEIQTIINGKPKNSIQQR